MNHERSRGVTAQLTRTADRGRLELPARNPCRFCHEKFRNFDELRLHAQAAHKREFKAVNRALADIDAKLRSLEQLAAEGMRGYAEYIIGGGHAVTGPIETIIQYVEEQSELTAER